MPELGKRSIVLAVPCFNEARRLDHGYFALLLGSIANLSLVFIDDGSTDETYHVLVGLCARLPRAEVIRLDRNVGKANAVRVGMLHAWHRLPRPSLTGYLDCDGAFAAGDVAAVSAQACQGRLDAPSPRAHFPRRSRNTTSTPAMRGLAGSLVRPWLSLGTTWPPTLDWQVGFKIYDTHQALHDAISVPFRSRWFPDAEILARMGQAGVSVVEPVLGQVDHIPGSSLRVTTVPSLALDLLRVKGAQLRAITRW